MGASLGGSFHLLMGITGNIMTLILFLDPARYFILAWRNGSMQNLVSNISPVSYQASLFNSMLWLLYGLPSVHPNSTLIITTNSAGCLIQVVYLLIWVIYSDDQNDKLMVIANSINEIIFMGIFAAAVLSTDDDTESRSSIVGPAAAVLHIALYVLLVLRENLVITTRNIEHVSQFMTYVCSINCWAWSMYAAYPFDPYLFVPYFVGFILWLVELGCFSYYSWSQK